MIINNRNEDERSAVTVMIYLNDDFEGGGTNFLQKKENAKLESYASNNNDVLLITIIIMNINEY